jgi:hypothetical protein
MNNDWDVDGNLRIVIEQHGCLAEVIVPGSVIREAHHNLNLKEFLQNSMVDLYARLAYMHRKSAVGGTSAGIDL